MCSQLVTLKVCLIEIFDLNILIDDKNILDSAYLAQSPQL